MKLISGGRVLDLAGDVDQPPVADVLIEHGRIVAVGADATERAAREAGIERIDATGKLVIPGLVNAHYHSHDVLLRGCYEQIPLDIWGFYSFPANYSRRSNEDVRLRTVLGAVECLSNGITTLQDMVTIVGPDREHVDAVRAAYEACGARVVLGLQISDRAAVDAVPFWRDMPEDVVRQLPSAVDSSKLQALIEELVEEGGTERLNWALAPSAPQRCSDDLLAWVAGLSARRQLQVFTHLYEARSQAVLARLAYPEGSLLAHLGRFDLVGPRLTIAHGVWIAPEEIERFGAAGANFVCNPMSNMKLLNGFAPVVHYAEAGANMGLGCDNCSCSDAQNLFQSMKMFALMWGFQTAVAEGDAAREAFRAATLGGAKAIGLEGEVGAIRPGYRADIVLIDLDMATYRPLNSALRQIVYGETGAGVHTVIVGGNIVVENRRHVAFPSEQLKAESEAALDRLKGEIEDVNKRNAQMLPQLLDAHEKANQYPLPLDRFSVRGDRRP
jgi:cytosine/adenosine deaminase-related metal-dependent hydrolase